MRRWPVFSDLPYNPPPLEKLDILYRDSDFLVVNKPAGLLTVPGRGVDKQDCLIARVHKKFTTARIIHRLDMLTSGLVIIALTDTTQKAISQLFEKRQIKKTYTALAHGKFEQTSGQIDQPLICDWPNRPKQIIDNMSGKPAITNYQILKYEPDIDITRVELFPLTGRTHQLRVHLASIGHPILGDNLYSGTEQSASTDRLYLHASELSFQHPRTQQDLSISSIAPF